MPIAYAYMRVSHMKSAESDLSHQTQDQSCRAYFEYRVKPQGVAYYEGPELYDPAVSARHVPFRLRKAGRRLFEMVRPGDHVIFSYLDRGFRELSDYVTLIDLWQTMNVTVHFADLGVDLSTYQGKLVANIMATIAQGQSDMLSARNKAIVAHQRKMNRPLNGKKRLGYKLTGSGKCRQWVPDVPERSVLAQIAKMHDQEGMTYADISLAIEQRMATMNHRQPNDGIWKPREWNRGKVHRAYHAWKAILEEEAGRA